MPLNTLIPAAYFHKGVKDFHGDDIHIAKVAASSVSFVGAYKFLAIL